MKLLLPAILCVVFAACESVVPAPQPGTAEHQRLLHEQARENFLALKAQERARTGKPAPTSLAARPPQATPPPARFQPTAVKPQQAARSASWKPLRAAKRAPVGDTIYEPTAEGRAEQLAWELRQAQEYLAFEAREARLLGKTPAQLTRQERAWIRARAE